jgi:hypothetical protein
VQENIAAGILLGPKNAISGVWITAVQAQIEIALRMEPVKLVRAFKNLLVSEVRRK